jgi:LysR family nitrogen assimilation transcriptional regulator
MKTSLWSFAQLCYLLADISEMQPTDGMMNIKHLEAYERAATLGSFTRAAEHMGLPQPSVSRMIGELESAWNCELFHRTGRGVTLTEAGHEAYGRIQQILGGIEALDREMQSFGQLPGGNVTLALPPSLVRTFLPKLLKKLREDRPAVRLRLYEGFSEQIQRWVSEGTVQVALFSEYGVSGQVPDQTPQDTFVLSHSRIVLCGRSLPETAGSTIAFARLADIPLVLPAPANGLRILVESLARRMAVPLQVVGEAGSLQAQDALAAGGFAATLRGESAVRQRRDGSACLMIVDPVIERRIVLTTERQSHLGRAARDVASLVTALLRQE